MTQDFFSPQAVEAYKVVGVPLLALIVVVIFIGLQVIVLTKKVDAMKDDYSKCLKGLSVDIKENTVVTQNGLNTVKDLLKEMRDIEREKLNIRKEEKGNEVRKIA